MDNVSDVSNASVLSYSDVLTVDKRVRATEELLIASEVLEKRKNAWQSDLDVLRRQAATDRTPQVSQQMAINALNQLFIRDVDREIEDLLPLIDVSGELARRESLVRGMDSQMEECIALIQDQKLQIQNLERDLDNMDRRLIECKENGKQKDEEIRRLRDTARDAGLESELGSKRSQALEEELATLAQHLKKQEDICADAGKQCADMEIAYLHEKDTGTSVRLELDSLKEQNTRRATELAALAKRVETEEAKVARLTAENAALSEYAEDMAAKFGLSNEWRSMAKGLHNDLRVEIDRIAVELTTETQRADDLHVQLQSLTAQHERSKALVQELTPYRASDAGLRARVVELEAAQAVCEEELADLAEVREALEGRVRSLGGDCERHKAANDASATVKEDVRMLTWKLEKAEERNKTMSSSLEACSAELNELKGRNAILTAKLERYHEDLKREVQEHSATRLSAGKLARDLEHGGAGVVSAQAKLNVELEHEIGQLKASLAEEIAKNAELTASLHALKDLMSNEHHFKTFNFSFNDAPLRHGT